MNGSSNFSDRQDLIATILQYQDLDSLLRLSVVLCNLELKGDGCSLFLRHPERNDLALRESTVLTRFLGQSLNIDLEHERAEAEKIRALLARRGKTPADLCRTLTAEEAGAWGDELYRCLYRFGLTRWAVQFRCPVVVDEVTEDIRWSSFNSPSGRGGPKNESEAREAENGGAHLWHRELGDHEIGSIAITLLGQGRPEELPSAVFRIVRRKARPGLSGEDLEWLEWFAGCLEKCMDVAVSLTELMEVGTKLEFEDFGNSLVRLLQKVFNATGCSIFLELGPASQQVRTFQCIATTGLYYKVGRAVDKEEARYDVDMEREESSSLTAWVLRHGQLLALDHGSWEFDPSRFPGLTRELGHGTFREVDPENPNLPAGPLLISPLFLHQGREVVGAIRLVRPFKADGFLPHEQFLFLDISRRLSKVLTNLNLRQASEKLIKLYNKPKQMLERVPLEVNRLLGVEGCSVFLLREGRYLELAASKGLLEGMVGKISYDITDPKTRGRTGWVAFEKKALVLNEPDQGHRIHPKNPPIASSKDSKNSLCEVAESAHRILGVPIFSEPEDPSSEVLGVIRAPRLSEDPPFVEEIHKSILVSFAARLSLALDMARRNRSLEAITELSHPSNVQQDPSSIARETIERTVNVLIEHVGLASAAVYRLDDRTEKLRLVKSRSVPDMAAPDPELHWMKDPQQGSYPICLGDARLGMILYKTYSGQSLTDRQNNLIGLIAGMCASVLYNEAAFNKLESIRQGLVEVGQKVTSKSKLVEKLEAIAVEAAHVTKADNVIIHEYVSPAAGDAATGGYFRESACGGPLVPRVWKETDFKPGAVPFKVVLLKKPIFESEASKSGILFHPKETLNFIEREGISSAAALPLGVSDTCVGCIFFNFRNEQPFNARQRQEIRIMAEYAAVAIYQSRLLEETRQLVQEKSNLLRYADHSMAQPLNALMGFLDNLASGVLYSKLTAADIRSKSAFSNSELARIANRQYQLCNYMAYLVDTFLRINRVEPGRLFEVESRSGQDLSRVCEEALDVAEAYLRGSIDRRIESTVHGNFDANAIKIAILNVLVNAIKYGRRKESPHGSPPIRLTLKTDRQNGHDRASIFVDDSGPGIPEDQRASIFRIGFRGSSAAQGLGIGLFLTQGYINAHHGEVTIEDSDLGGARFILRLPVNLGSFKEVRL